MTKAEREKLLEEKKNVIGLNSEARIKEVSLSRKRFFEVNADKDDKNSASSKSTLTESERALLKVVISTLAYFISNTH